MDNGLLATLVTALVTLLGVFGVWAKVSSVFKAVKEISDVGVKVNSIMADGMITSDEIAELKKELQEARDAIKSIGKK